MKLSRALVLILALGSFAFGDVLFTNGTDIGVGGDYLSSPGAGSQQFNLSVESILASMTISTWTNGGGPSTLSWTISTNPPGGGGVLDSGSSAVTDVLNFTSGYNVYNTTGSLPGIDLVAGTYWLTLQSDTSSDSSTVYWGVTNPTGLGAQTSSDNVTWTDRSGSWNYVLELDGSSAVPEPGTLGLLGLSLTGLGFLRRKSFGA
jgi:hypothetical protein